MAMQLRPLDTVIAHKAINLSSELSGSEKRVAGAIVDHFNRKTGRCDPSLDRIAGLLGISRRTVIRAVKRMQNAGLFRKDRHGGLSHRNSYQPIWPRFREIEAKWNERFRTKRKRSAETKVSPFQRQSCHLAGDSAGTQTCLTNQSNETLPNGRQTEHPSTSSEPTSCKRLGRIGNDQTVENPVGQFVSRERNSKQIEVARSAAERRLSAALQETWGATPKIYAEVLNAIDPAMWGAAIDAEFRKHGAGLAFILDKLRIGRTANKPDEPGAGE
jgi:DNA-binding MarR family transcriptional regulator